MNIWVHILKTTNFYLHKRQALLNQQLGGAFTQATIAARPVNPPPTTAPVPLPINPPQT